MYQYGQQYGQQAPGQSYQPYSSYPVAPQQFNYRKGDFKGQGKGGFGNGGGMGKGGPSPQPPHYHSQSSQPQRNYTMDSWTPLCERPIDETKLKECLGSWADKPAIEAFKHFKLCSHILTQRGVDCVDSKFASGKVPVGAFLFVSKRDQLQGPGQFARDIMSLSLIHI